MAALDRSLLARLHADLGSILSGNNEKESAEPAERLRKLQVSVDDMLLKSKAANETKPPIDSSSKPKRSVAEVDADLRALLAAYATTSACALEEYMTRFRTEASRLLEERRVSV